MKIKVIDFKKIIKETLKENERRDKEKPCNCENSKCSHKAGVCPNKAGKQKAMYIGAICDECSKKFDKEYLLNK